MPVVTEIKSLGGSFDLKITKRYPEDMRFNDPDTEKWVTDNPWLIFAHLGPNEAKAIQYYALTPDKPGKYTLLTEVGDLENDTYKLFQNLATDVTVDKLSTATVSDALAALGSLSVSGNDKSKADEAVTCLKKARDRGVTDEGHVEQNIHDLLKAIDALLSITSADVSQIRLMLDRLIRIEEGRFYFDF